MSNTKSSEQCDLIVGDDGTLRLSHNGALIGEVKAISVRQNIDETIEGLCIVDVELYARVPARSRTYADAPLSEIPARPAPPPDRFVREDGRKS